MKLNLSLTPNETQRCASAGSQTKAAPFALLAQTRSSKPLRIPLPAIAARPVLRGNRDYLRTLREAEMAAWNAGKKFALVLTFAAMLAASASASEKSAVWQTDANGQWADANHWSTYNFPDNAGTNVYSATVDMPNRTVTLDRNVTIESFSLARGAVEGTNAPALTLNQQFHWGATKFIGEGLLSANGMTVTGATKTVRGWTLENRGVANWLAGDIHLGDGARFYNQPNAGFNANFDGTIINDLGGTALLENAGMFRKSGGTNQTKILIPFLNTGTVEVDSGELAFFGNTTNLGGNLQVLDGAALQFTGLRHTFDASSKLQGNGTVEFENGTVDFGGTVDVKGPVIISIGTVNLTPASTVRQFGGSLTFAQSGTLNLNSGETNFWNSLTLSNGQFNGSDSVHAGAGGFLWTGGTFKGSGQIDLDGNSVFTGGSKTLRGWLMQNHANVQWIKGDVFTGEGSRFVNQPGASVQTPFDGTWAIGSGGTSRIENLGVLQKMGGINLTTFALPFYNEGLVVADVGAIKFAGSLTNLGALTMPAGAAFIFASTSVQLDGLGSLDGDGAVILDSGNITDSGSFRAGAGVTLKGGALRFTNTTSRPNFGAQIRFHNVATLDLNSGFAVSVPQLLHTNGLISGSDNLVVSNEWVCVNGDLDGPGRLELRGTSWINGGPRWTGKTVANHGEFNWAGGDIDAGLGLLFHNNAGGVVSVNCDRMFSTSFGGSAVLLNEGSFRKDSGSGTTTFVLPFINNNGQVNVNSGRLQFTGGYAQTNGLLALNGTTVGSIKPFLIRGGTVAGNGAVLGSILNEGTLQPGWGDDAGRINISGNCTQTVTATLQIKLGGTHRFDVLAITNLASLNGRLALNVLPDFTPKIGDTFPFLTCGSRTGQFAEITGATLPGELKLTPVYSANGVTLTVISTAAPAPNLAIEWLAETNALKVSWPGDAGDWTVQGCTNLSAPDWVTLPPSGTNSIIVPANLRAQFYRLMKPAI
ncbi:MAG TPA: hypothetical protein VNN22_02970 [Verrucomicrobiae bacterium]|nr:hypothetical protein [Verrucomicrobiae bacterium]